MTVADVYNEQYNYNNNNSADPDDECLDVAECTSIQCMSTERSCVGVDQISTPRCFEDASQSEPRLQMMSVRHLLHSQITRQDTTSYVTN